ncbi:hypothetical protein HDV00_012671 [Rhizophlyctis rosea]|nr:hypothetical protein HDV00_012671 [Rhizophlyctis rosea]
MKPVAYFLHGRVTARIPIVASFHRRHGVGSGDHGGEWCAFLPSLCVELPLSNSTRKTLAPPTAILLLSTLLSTATAALLPPSNTQTSINLLFQNNLNLTDNANHVGALLLDSMAYPKAEAACAALYETLVTKDVMRKHEDDFRAQLAYASNVGYAKGWSYYIRDAIVKVSEGSPLEFAPLIAHPKTQLPILCTQSAPSNAAASATTKITVSASGNTYTGFRNQKSFRFLGIPYANFTERFTHSKLLTATGVNYDATVAGPQCLQYGSGAEHCLFLNIYTPYIPKSGSKANLRPVHFWIHGGGFEGGKGSDFDGGELASREDVVTVNFNYRLGAYGFMAVPGILKGNYGIGDQINALDWTIKNIAKFGGDPDAITINGGSAGAASVRVLLGSPKAIGKFAAAIAMSNLGGGKAFGSSGDYSTAYSDYYTIEEAYEVSGKGVFIAAGCNQTSTAEQVKCLRSYKGNDISSQARYVVQDGSIVVTPRLEVTKRSKNTAHVPVMFGIMTNDGASFNRYNKTCTTKIDCLAADTQISADWAKKVIDSGLFPYYSTGDVVEDSYNVSQRIVTDTMFRCVDQAGIYAAAKSGAFSKSYYYESVRGYAPPSYNPNGVDITGPITPGYPHGNPNLPYYKIHGGDTENVFGGLSPLRDAGDLKTTQLGMAYYGAFIRNQGDPNPEGWYLKAREYTDVLKAVRETGRWEAVKGERGPVAFVDYPTRFGGFVDVPQCKWLNYSLEYYFEGR